MTSFVSDSDISLGKIRSLLSRDTKIAVFDIHSTLIDKSETKIHSEVKNAIGLIIREEFTVVLVVQDIKWNNKTEILTRQIFIGYKKQILVLTLPMRKNLIKKLTGKKSESNKNNLDALFILKHTADVAKFYFISSDNNNVKAWKANKVDVVKVSDGIHGLTVDEIKAILGRRVKFITGMNVTVEVLKKHFSTQRMLIGIDVHSTITDGKETMVLPESRSSINKVIKLGYPVYILTNGVWSSSMKMQVEKAFVDVGNIMRMNVEVVVLDWRNRKRLVKKFGVKEVDVVGKIDVIKMLEQINPTAALVLIDNSSHNIKSWTRNGKLGIHTEKGITVKSIDQVHSSSDLNVDKIDALTALAGIQEAIRAETFFDYINNKHFTEKQVMKKFPENEISPQKSHPVVGNLIRYFNIWLPMMKFYLEEFNNDSLKHHREVFKVKLITQNNNWDLGKEKFLTTRKIYEVFQITTYSEKQKEAFYMVLISDIQRDLDNRYSANDVNFSTSFDNKNLYLEVSNFSFELVFDHLPNKKLVVPLLWQDKKKNMKEIRAVFETIVPQGLRNVPMMWHALLEPASSKI